ncbi:hypothetical protein TNCV_2780591 [Trichonephila clavipes]|nr:hypothetical protein TNCV_2780591 [Trichonephila clavipes]
MRLQKRKGTVDGYEWRCRNQSKDNRHDVVRSVSEDKSNDFVKLAHSTGENGTIAVNLKNLLLAFLYE